MPVLLLLFAVAALAYEPPQEPDPEKEKVHLLSAQSAQLIEKDGENYRKVVGPAKFLHNNTYLLCDTALWNVNTNIIDATGNVQIIQERTKLSSATLQYVVDDNMAKFRGDLVQLEDSDHNTLRTRYLDYNTKDSVAIFQNGAAMRDKDGQVIESLYGTYDAKAHLFVFNDKVNMYMDTTFVKTSRLEYRSDLSTAYFGYGTDMWQDDQMLSAHDGWYDRNQELYFFRRQVHLLTKDQEIWSDSLYYHRLTGDVEMLGHVEIMDTTRNVFGLAGRLEYSDSLSQIRMSRDPAIMSVSDENEQRDTLYVGADILFSRSYKRCDIPKEWEKDAEKRLKDISGDPVMEYRKKAAEEAAKKAEEALKNDPAKQAEEAARKLREQNQKGKNKPAQEEQPEQQEDTVAVSAQAPVATAPVDTLPPPPDTSKVNIIWGSKNVRLFRRDMQMAGDSLYYTDLDSLIRLYQDPIFFNSGNRQYTADSIFMVIKDRRMQRAHLLSNAFITIEEAPHTYDQIRGTEMVAYFDSTNALTRFDALGGASSLFYLEENDALATVNKVEAKMIYATFRNDTLSRMYYYENPKNDGYPSVQLPEEEKTLKGFRWEPERKPQSPLDVTELEPRHSERLSYLARPHAQFQQTEDYFPGYINKLYRDIAIRDSLTVVRQREKKEREERERELAALASQADTLQAPVDTLMPPVDTLKAPADTLKAPQDTLQAAPSDSLGAVQAVKKELTPQELRKAEKARKEAEKARIRQQKEEERKARWAELDRRDAEKKAAKEQKKLEKERARKLKALQKLEKKAQKERARFEKYLRREQERELRRQNKRKN